MRDELDASAEEAADVRLAEAGLSVQGLEAEIEDLALVSLASEQALGGGADAGDIRDGVLAHALAGSDVGQQAALVDDLLDRERLALARGDGLAGEELHALEDGGTQRVEPLLLGGGKGDGDAAGLDARDEAETQFGFTFTDTALTDHTERHGG